MIKQCDICGAWFTAKGRELCCSAACSDARRARMKLLYNETRKASTDKPLYEGECVVCGKTFRTGVRAQIYCGDKCGSAAYHARLKGISVPKVSDKKVVDQQRAMKHRSLDEVLRDCYALGISYSEKQKRKTIDMYAHVEVSDEQQR